MSCHRNRGHGIFFVGLYSVSVLYFALANANRWGEICKIREAKDKYNAGNDITWDHDDGGSVPAPSGRCRLYTAKEILLLGTAGGTGCGPGQYA